ncbi:MAG: hypothetical protein ABSA53_38900 [Streptosporangiaceae bacterium]
MDGVLVAEVVSPGSSLKTDTVDKKAVYADAVLLCDGAMTTISRYVHLFIV